MVGALFTKPQLYYIKMGQSKEMFRQSLPVFPSEQRKMREQLEELNQRKLTEQKQKFKKTNGTN